MEVKTYPVQNVTYSIEGLTATEASAVVILLGRAGGELGTTTHDICMQLLEALKKNGAAPVPLEGDLLAKIAYVQRYRSVVE